MFVTNNHNLSNKPQSLLRHADACWLSHGFKSMFTNEYINIMRIGLNIHDNPCYTLVNVGTIGRKMRCSLWQDD